jgi:hypothetical protein
LPFAGGGLGGFSPAFSKALWTAAIDAALRFVIKSSNLATFAEQGFSSPNFMPFPKQKKTKLLSNLVNLIYALPWLSFLVFATQYFPRPAGEELVLITQRCEMIMLGESSPSPEQDEAMIAASNSPADTARA